MEENPPAPQNQGGRKSSIRLMDDLSTALNPTSLPMLSTSQAALEKERDHRRRSSIRMMERLARQSLALNRMGSVGQSQMFLQTLGGTNAPGSGHQLLRENSSQDSILGEAKSAGPPLAIVPPWRLPYSDFRVYWEAMYLCLSLVSLVLSPNLILFRNHHATTLSAVDHLVLALLQLALDVYYMLNLFLRCRRFVIEDEDEGLCDTPSRIMLHFISTRRFVLECLSALPGSILLAAFVDPTLVFGSALTLMMVLPTLVRACGFFYGFEHWKLYLEYKYGAFNTAALAMTKVFLLMLVLLNVFSCVYLKLAVPDGQAEGGSWIDAAGFADLSLSDQLLRSYYVIAQTIFTVGYGDFTPQTISEILFINLVMFVGVLLYALLIAIMTSVIANQDATGMEYKTNMAKIKTLFQIHQLRETEEERFEQYYVLMKSRHGGKSELELLEYLTPSLALEVANLSRKSIEGLPLFAGRSKQASFWVQLVKIFVPRTYPADMKVARAGCVARDLLILRSGRMDVVLPQVASVGPPPPPLNEASSKKPPMSVIVTKVLAGEAIGEYESIVESAYGFDYVAQSYCELLVLDLEDLLPVFEGVGSSLPTQLRHLRQEYHQAFHQIVRDSVVDPTQPRPSPNEIDAECLTRVTQGFEKAFPQDQRASGLVSVLEAHALRLSNYHKQLEILQRNSSERNKKTQMLFGSASSANVLSKSKVFTIPLESRTRAMWDILMFHVMVYFSIAGLIHVQQGAIDNQNFEAYQWSFVFEYVLDVILILDIVCNVMFFEYEEQDDENGVIIIRDRESIRQHYVEKRRGKMILDCVSAFPYDVIALGSGLGYYAFFRLPRMLRMFYLSEYATLTKEHLENLGFRLSSTFVQQIKLFLAVAIVTIFTSCFWSICHPFDQDIGSLIASIYWSLTTMTTIGFGDITPSESLTYFYTILVIIIGTTLGAAVVANIATIVHAVVISEDNFQHRQNCVNQYLESHDVSEDLVRECQRYYQFTYKQWRGLVKDRVVTELMPFPIQDAFHETLRHPLLCACPLFGANRLLSPSFIYTLTNVLETETVLSNELVVPEGTPFRGQVFIVSGAIYLQHNGKGIRLENGESFAESALYTQAREDILYSATVINTSVIYVLPHGAYQNLDRTFPHEFSLLKTKALALDRKRGERIRKSRTRDRKLRSLDSTFTGETNGKKKQSDHDHDHDGPVIFLPDEAGQQYWHSVMLVVVLCNAILVPVGIAFGIQNYYLVMLYIGDLALVMNMVLRAQHFAYISSDKIVKEPMFIRRRYIYGTRLPRRASAFVKFRTFVTKGELLKDLVASFPFELLTPMLFPNNGRWKSTQILCCLRLSKMLHCRHVSLYMRNYGKRLRATFNLSPNFMKVSKLVFVLVLICHWFGCIWFMIAVYGNMDRNWAKDATNTNFLDSDVTWVTQYIASFYWAVFTLTTVGYGDISPQNLLELCFATLVLICGTGAYTIVIANLEEIVAQVDVTSTLHQLKLERLKLYFKARRLSPLLQDRIQGYMKMLWLKSKGVREHRVLEMLSSRHRAEVVTAEISPLITRESLFGQVPQVLLSRVYSALYPETYLPGDFLFEKHACAESNIFLTGGTVEYLSDSNALLLAVSNPEPLCEVDFLTQTLRTCHARAKTTCSVFLLHREDYLRVFLDFPQEHEHFLSQIEASKVDMNLQLKSLDRNVHNAKIAQMLSLSIQSPNSGNVIWYPESTFRRMWETLMLSVTVYHMLYLPYRWSLMQPHERLNPISQVFMLDLQPFVFGMDIVADLVSVVHIYFCLNHFTRIEQGVDIHERRDIRASYLKSNFVLDLVTILPVDLVAYIAGVRALHTLGNLRLGRILMVYYLPLRFQNLIHFLEEYGVHWSIGVWQAVKSFAMVICVSHWLGCGFYALAFMNDFQSTWIEHLELTNETQFTQYAYACYWATYTVTTVGFGDVSPQRDVERLYAIVAMFLGAILCDAGLTAILTALIDSLDSKAGENVALSECFKQYMTYRQYPVHLRQRIQNYLLYNNINIGVAEELLIWNNLSFHLNSSIVNELCFLPMSQSPLFVAFQPAFVRSITRHMQPRTILPKEVVWRIGQKSDEMICIHNGFIQVSDASSPMGMTVLSIDDVFCEFEDVCQYTHKALSFCHVYTLAQSKYQEALGYLERDREASSSSSSPRTSSGDQQQQPPSPILKRRRTSRRRSSFDRLTPLLFWNKIKIVADLGLLCGIVYSIWALVFIAIFPFVETHATHALDRATWLHILTVLDNLMMTLCLILRQLALARIKADTHNPHSPNHSLSRSGSSVSINSESESSANTNTKSLGGRVTVSHLQLLYAFPYHTCVYFITGDYDFAVRFMCPMVLHLIWFDQYLESLEQAYLWFFPNVHNDVVDTLEKKGARASFVSTANCLFSQVQIQNSLNPKADVAKPENQTTIENPKADDDDDVLTKKKKNEEEEAMRSSSAVVGYFQKPRNTQKVYVSAEEASDEAPAILSSTIEEEEEECELESFKSESSGRE